MKKYKGYIRYYKHVSNYRNYPEGIMPLGDGIVIEAVSETVAANEFYCEYDSDKYFPQDDGTVTDHNGVVRYTEGDTVIDMGDYQIYVEEIK